MVVAHNNLINFLYVRQEITIFDHVKTISNYVIVLNDSDEDDSYIKVTSIIKKRVASLKLLP